MALSAAHMVPGKKHAPQNLGRVLILGLGKSGRAATNYCLDLLGTRIESLTIAGGEPNIENEAFVTGLPASGVEVSFGNYEFFERYDLCIASPGIPQMSDFYQNAQAASGELISEVEFAWRESEADSRWIAITGTNGKTTTTSLCAHILQEAGMSALAVGNIGETCLEAVAHQRAEIYVVEVSSYQLASTKLFAPDVAVLLNITPDHISWHGSFEEYTAAKLKLFAHLSDHAFAVFDTTDFEVRRFVREQRLRQEGQSPVPHIFTNGFYVPLGAAAGLRADMRQVCGSLNAGFVRDESLVISLGNEENELIHQDALQIKGDHNIANALAASAAALVLGVSKLFISAALASFKPLEHRIEPCGSIEGVRLFNDSKATNVDSTRKALTAFGDTKPIVLLGGFDKGTDLDALVKDAELHGKAVICFGAAGPRFLEAFSAANIPSYLADSLESALDCALEHAESGDVIVLSPACASFDEFTSFEDRGTSYKDMVFRRSTERGV